MCYGQKSYHKAKHKEYREKCINEKLDKLDVIISETRCPGCGGLFCCVDFSEYRETLEFIKDPNSKPKYNDDCINRIITLVLWWGHKQRKKKCVGVSHTYNDDLVTSIKSSVTCAALFAIDSRPTKIAIIT